MSFMGKFCIKKKIKITCLKFELHEKLFVVSNKVEPVKVLALNPKI